MNVSLVETADGRREGGRRTYSRILYRVHGGELLIWRALALTYKPESLHTLLSLLQRVHVTDASMRSADAPRASESAPPLCVSELIALHGIKVPVSLSLCERL